MEAFFSLFQRVEPRLHSFLSDTDRKRIRTALYPPSPLLHGLNDQAVLTMGVSILLTALVFYVCRSPSPLSAPLSSRPRMGYRSTDDKVSSAAVPSSSSSGTRDSVVSWNIGRLLKPLNERSSSTS